ncbi:MAG TPA: cardiolipin synthase [Gemmata sp.]|jgi:cardiolipin synthase|nr:cardiolipin synthase [Gemmata sp.]
MSPSDFFFRFWQDITGWALLFYLLLTLGTFCLVLHTKRETMSAIAWSLTVLLFPLFGAFLFFVFGSQSITRPLMRKQQKKSAYKRISGSADGRVSDDVPARWDRLAKLGQHGDGFPVTGGNSVTLYHEGRLAFDAMLEAIRAAQNHVHIQFFIFRSDASGARFIDALCECARRGVEVRFLYDSVGSYSLSRQLLRKLAEAGGRYAAFLPILNPLYRFRVNLRNHRKILVVDGRVGFTGGFNIGDEYLGLARKFGPWRDTFIRVEGEGVHGLQRVFQEDWHFATEEAVHGERYTPKFEKPPGTALLQVVHSGPDSSYKAIRETYFAGILHARKRVWIASPYFVPDAGLKDALILAAWSGVDVRLLGLFRPDKWLPFLAARFYWTDVLEAGVKVYQYSPGMMHSKIVMVDGEWASIGTANMDNRSLLLNFEVNYQLFDGPSIAELEQHFLADLDSSVRVDTQVFSERPFISKLAENASRLLSPIL